MLTKKLPMYHPISLISQPLTEVGFPPRGVPSLHSDDGSANYYPIDLVIVFWSLIAVLRSLLIHFRSEMGSCREE